MWMRDEISSPYNDRNSEATLGAEVHEIHTHTISLNLTFNRLYRIYNSDLTTCLAAFTPTVLHSRYYEQVIGGGAFLIYSSILKTYLESVSFVYMKTV